MDPENRNTMVPIETLPDEMLLHIFSHLDMEDLVPSSYVCRRWERLIKDRQSLWGRKEYLYCDSTHASQVQAIIYVMPRLKVVRIVIGQRSEVHIAWPEATVVLQFGHDDEDDDDDDYGPEFISYQCILRTDTYLVSRLVANNVPHFLDWVEQRSLKAIYVGEQCIASVKDSTSSFSSFMDSSVCDIPECILHRSIPSLYQIPLSPRKFLRSSGYWQCPALEQLSIRCAIVLEYSLEIMTRLGPIRVLRVMLHDVESFSFLDSCPKQLEVLSVTRAPELPADRYCHNMEFFHERSY